MERPEERLIVALDFPIWEEAVKMAERLEEALWFKIGLEMFLASRGRGIQALKALGKKVFLDLKFHDIPHTVAQACRQGVAYGADMLNVHTLGGRVMMEQAAQAVAEEAALRKFKAPLLIGVTVLTSMDDGDMKEVGLAYSSESQVQRLAGLAQRAGLGGVVASPREIPWIREACGADFSVICPGIRPAKTDLGDQKRVMTPGEAIRAGADYLVIGRPIIQNRDPVKAFRAALREMKEVG
jgi:orotidine-5'-phosphate decarboxylase